MCEDLALKNGRLSLSSWNSYHVTWTEAQIRMLEVETQVGEADGKAVVREPMEVERERA